MDRLFQKTTSRFSDSLKDNKTAEDPSWYILNHFPLPESANENNGCETYDRRNSYDSMSSEGKNECPELCMEEAFERKEIEQANLVSIIRRTSRKIATTVNEQKPHLDSNWYLYNGFPIPSGLDDSKR